MQIWVEMALSILTNIFILRQYQLISVKVFYDWKKCLTDNNRY